MGMLLDLAGDAFLQELAAEYDHQLRYVLGHVKERLGLSAILVRPDGVVAWTCGGEARQESILQSADRWFARKETH